MPCRSPRRGSERCQIIFWAANTSFLYTATGLPPGLVIDPMKGTIRGWIDPLADGDYDTIISVDDLNGGVTSVEFNWNVTRQLHQPWLSRWTDGLSTVGDWVSIPGTPTWYTYDGEVPTGSFSGLPPGLTYDPATDWWSGTLTTAGAYTVTLTVSDAGGTDTSSFQKRRQGQR